MPPKHPALYEINTPVWLNDLSQKYERPVDLSSVPAEEWQAVAALGIHYVWLMGVWQRSPSAVAITRNNPIAIDQFKQVMPDYEDKDLIGSAYSIKDYTADSRVGGSQGLACARQQLAALGIGLILDYVPNHVAPDHAWTQSHPQVFIHGAPQDLERDPESFMQIGDSVIARGRDPNFSAWQDVLQLNAFHPDLRSQTTKTINAILDQCDGVRVDMAMLMINRIFQATWKQKAGPILAEEFWPAVIAKVRAKHLHALFIAEAYWNTEGELQHQGFDYCYDKGLYDAIRDRSARQLCATLKQDSAFQQRLVRFIENHDEHRAADAFTGAYGHVAAMLAATLPGMRFFHEGQFEGRRKRISVLLGRRPQENPDPDSLGFYTNLLELLSYPVLQDGEWSLLTVQSDKGGMLSRCLAWSWRDARDALLVIANISDQPYDVTIQTDIPPHTCLEKIFASAPWAKSTPQKLLANEQGILSLTIPPEDAAVYSPSF